MDPENYIRQPTFDPEHDPNNKGRRYTDIPNIRSAKSESELRYAANQVADLLEQAYLQLNTNPPADIKNP